MLRKFAGKRLTNSDIFGDLAYQQEWRIELPGFASGRNSC